MYKVSFKGNKIRAIINCRATGNFINPKTVLEHGIITNTKLLYKLVLANRLAGSIKLETRLEKIVIYSGHKE